MCLFVIVLVYVALWLRFRATCTDILCGRASKHTSSDCYTLGLLYVHACLDRCAYRWLRIVRFMSSAACFLASTSASAAASETPFFLLLYVFWFSILTILILLFIFVSSAKTTPTLLLEIPRAPGPSSDLGEARDPRGRQRPAGEPSNLASASHVPFEGSPRSPPPYTKGTTTMIHNNIYTYAHIYIYRYIYLSIYIYICIAIYLSICLSIYIYIYMPMYIYI